MTTQDSAVERVAAWLAELEKLEPVPGADGKPTSVVVEPGTRPGETVVSLPGNTRLHVPISVLVSQRSVEVSAFVCRNPESNYVEVYRWLLRRNARLRSVAFAVDDSGDIYVRGRLPAGAISADDFDALLGETLDAADGAFNEIISRGFVESVRAEYAWRVSRGLSTRNLDAFRHIIDDPHEEDPD